MSKDTDSYTADNYTLTYHWEDDQLLITKEWQSSKYISNLQLNKSETYALLSFIDDHLQNTGGASGIDLWQDLM